VQLELSPTIASERQQLSQFLFDNVYRHEQLIVVRKKAAERVCKLYNRLVESPHLLPDRFMDRSQKIGVEKAVGHYIAGMTDRFCDRQYRSLIELGQTAAEDW
jgi:dGTPase